MERAGVGSSLGLQPGSPPFKLLHNVMPSQHEIWMLTRACILGGVRTLGCKFPSPTGKKRMLPERKWGWFDLELPPKTLHNRLTNSCSLHTIALVRVCVCACQYKCVRLYLSHRVSVGASRALPPLFSTRSWLPLARKRTNA